VKDRERKTETHAQYRERERAAEATRAQQRKEFNAKRSELKAQRRREQEAEREAEDAAADVASSPVPAALPGGKRKRGERGPRRSEVSLLTLTPRSRGGPPIAGVLVSPRPLPPAAEGDAVALVTPAFDAVPLAPRRLRLRASDQRMLSAPVLRSTMYNRVGEVVQLVAELAPTDDDRARMLQLLERRLWPERIAHRLEAETALQIVRNLRLALRAMPPSARVG
jgi:hypothetical protein